MRQNTVGEEIRFRASWPVQLIYLACFFALASVTLLMVDAFQPVARASAIPLIGIGLALLLLARVMPHAVGIASSLVALGLVFLFESATDGFVEAFGLRLAPEPAPVALVLAFAAGALALARHLRHKQLASADRFRSDLARIVLEQAPMFEREGYEVDLSLYLRPFQTTGAHRYVNPWFRGFLMPHMLEEPYFLDLEHLLARALVPAAPLIALGRPGEHEGAGRVLTTEEDWREAVRRLLRCCGLIVVVPSAKEGTQWEIGEIIANGHIEKAVFIMPPSSPFERRDAAADWEAARLATLERHGLTLPGYDGRFGRVFTYDRDLSPCPDDPLALNHPRFLQATILQHFERYAEQSPLMRGSLIAEPPAGRWLRRQRRIPYELLLAGIFGLFIVAAITPA